MALPRNQGYYVHRWKPLLAVQRFWSASSGLLWGLSEKVWVVYHLHFARAILLSPSPFCLIQHLHTYLSIHDNLLHCLDASRTASFDVAHAAIWGPKDTYCSLCLLRSSSHAQQSLVWHCRQPWFPSTCSSSCAWWERPLSFYSELWISSKTCYINLS